ncbi:polymorphic toxin-type HINT domain-containing protein [Isoptericola jiangsuensis]|uniref:polymorphic toxin-type HINT domain-containing protein n=1 Tax=Isoptericola jiangsuensis TaxID=548579 RepID=UPI000BF8F76C|nr:polymorphic toxin-type HINT domain-containing protein [Isoptericola jiangsuensis]
MSDRDRSANTAIDRIEDITGSDDLNDGWWDDWGAKVVAAIADIADLVSTIAGVLAIVVAFIPVVGTALAGVLLVVAAVAAIVSMLANLTLAATGERSWAEAGIAIAGAALSVIGLGGAAKAAMGLSKVALKQGVSQGAKKAWCKVGFGTCFTAGTLVRTADGDRPIETLRAGDKVWAHDPTTGLDQLHLVTETFARTTTTLYRLTIDGHDLVTTDEHPFAVANMGWILARDLQPGDILTTPDGDTVTLDRIDVEHTDQPVAVHNIHVATHHTYYVFAGTTAVLVHNAGGHGAAANARGLAREERVAKIVGGKVAKGPDGQDIKITVDGVGSTGLDVIGPNGEYIFVGGPAKAKDPAKFGHALKVSKAAADRDGVRALYCLEDGTPTSAIDQAGRKLGVENVFTFPKD